MGREEGRYTPVHSASMVAPAVPLVYVVIGYDRKADTFFEYECDVVAVVAKVTTTYFRDRRSEYDAGNPRLPPTGKNMTDEGFRVRYPRGVSFSCVVVGEYGLEEYEGADNTAGILWEKGRLPIPEGVIDEKKKSLRDRLKPSPNDADRN